VFRLVYGNGSRFKKIFAGLVKPLDNVPIGVTSNGMEMRALTPDKNMMIEVVIPSSSFEVVEVVENTVLALSRDSFLRAIRRASKQDSITLSYEKASRYVKLLLSNIKTGVEREFNIEVSEAIESLVEPLSIDLPVKFQIATDDLKKLIRDVKIVGDELEVTFRENSIDVSSSSEGKSYRTTLRLDRPLYQLESKEVLVSSKYDVDYLKTVASAITVADLVSVEFGSGLPMKIYAPLEDGSRITIWIAPRV
jgi:proliferating cell nuclear antigen